jgi:hypothetical protein
LLSSLLRPQTGLYNWLSTWFHHCFDPLFSMSLTANNQHYKNPTKGVGLVQSGPHPHLIEN